MTQPTYREHQQLVRAIHELAEMLDRQSGRIGRTVRQGKLARELPEASPLRTTWPQLGQAFRLLLAHARSIEDEHDRLGIAGHA